MICIPGHVTTINYVKRAVCEGTHLPRFPPRVTHRTRAILCVQTPRRRALSRPPSSFIRVSLIPHLPKADSFRQNLFISRLPDSSCSRCPRSHETSAGDTLLISTVPIRPSVPYEFSRTGAFTVSRHHCVAPSHRNIPVSSALNAHPSGLRPRVGTQPGLLYLHGPLALQAHCELQQGGHSSKLLPGPAS